MGQHGTRSNYTMGCRCVPCREANTAYQRIANIERTERTNRGDGPPVHGYSGYTNWGCRCEICTEANSGYCRSRRFIPERTRTT